MSRAEILSDWDGIVSQIGALARVMTDPDSVSDSSPEYYEYRQMLTDELHFSFHRVISKYDLSDTPGADLAVKEDYWSRYDDEE